MIDQSIAHYRVTAKLGAGGMGEVYRATDTKLGRDVALKVLPPAFAKNEQRMARFQREAQVLASLNHPNIAAIHGLEHHNEIQALAMELVEGPTLAERLATGAVPLEEALAIAKQIAEALEYAHEKGIIHRDLKPANVKLTPDGTAKLLDFGLAKALSDDPVTADISSSPTLSMAATKAGIILGTAAYMSPEQARGRVVDRRSDIWSFGVVIYEMLSGRRAFPGEDASETMATVIKDQPNWEFLPAETPRRIRELLRRCLAKDPRQRLQAIGDARLEIQETLAGAPDISAERAALAVPGPRSARATLLVAVLVLAALALGAALAWMFKPAAKAPSLVRVAEVVPPESLPNTPALRIQGLLAISSDGKRFVLVTPKGLQVRSLDSLKSTILAGTEGAASPFFSPDGRWIGFYMEGQFRKIPAEGGSIISICPYESGVFFNASWSPDNTILLSAAFAGVQRVSAEGGTPTVLVAPEKGRLYLRARALPDGKRFLYIRAIPGSMELWEAVVQSFGKDDATVVMRGVVDILYAATGHLIYGQGMDLFAVPFDLKTLRTQGEPTVIGQNVSLSSTLFTPHFAISDSGTLIYVQGRASMFRSRLVAVDRSGKLALLPNEVRAYSDPRVSPDGRLVAVHLEDEQNDVWVANTERGTISRISFDPGEDETPAWSPDGQWVAWSSSRTGVTRAIYRRRADGSGAEELLWQTERHTHLREWLPGGKVMLIEQLDPAANTDILVLELGEKPAAKPYLQTRFNERNSRVSPDGRWIVYTSDESGRDQIYVQSFPEPGAKMQVSTDGGNEAVWSRDGRSIYFRSGGSLYEAAFQGQPRPSVGTPKPLFPDKFESPQLGGHTGYDARPGGLLMIQSADAQESAKEARTYLVFVFNALQK